MKYQVTHSCKLKIVEEKFSYQHIAPIQPVLRVCKRYYRKSLRFRRALKFSLHVHRYMCAYIKMCKILPVTLPTVVVYAFYLFMHVWLRPVVVLLCYFQFFLLSKQTVHKTCNMFRTELKIGNTLVFSNKLIFGAQTSFWCHLKFEQMSLL